MTFPTTGKGGKTWDLLTSHVAEWQETFPSLDVLAECRMALSWVRANPGRAKTVGGMTRFLYKWLARSQDGGRGKGGAAGQPQRGSPITPDRFREILLRGKPEDGKGGSQ